MSGHTPGPWFMGPAMRSEEHGYTGHSITARPDPETYSVWVADSLGQHVEVPVDQIEANARLIAAAPEMLFALQQADEWIKAAVIAGCSLPSVATLTRTRDAIAKATHP